MASSNASLFISISTRVLLLLLLLGCFRPSSSAVIQRRTESTDNTNARWRSPCAGGSAVTVASDVPEETVTMTMGEATDAFAELSRRSTVLKQIVNTLKNEYVLRRFGNAGNAEQWTNKGLVITGSPSWTVSNGNTRETMLTCYENLARLAVLTRLVREGEQSAEANERHHFATALQGIENNHEAGLYVLMCNLHNVMTSWGIAVMSPETQAAVASISFEAVSNNAIRHVRDYLVLLVLENSADQLSSNFDRLVGQSASQTTPSQTTQL